MFEVFANSIAQPKLILNYHNKKVGFVILYLIFLVLLMSISTFVFFISTKTEPINEEITGCEIIEGSLACTGENYDINNKYQIYDFNLYLLTEEASIGEINNISDFALIIQGSKLTVMVGERTINSIQFVSVYNIDSIEQAVSILKFSIIFAGVTLGILSNLFILLFIILISTIPFLRFKSYIRYGKIFKLLTFASSPMAFLFAIYNLLNFDVLIFFILMLFAYRSVFTLQKEIYFKVMKNQSINNYRESVENYQEETKEDNEEEDNNEKEDE